MTANRSVAQLRARRGAKKAVCAVAASILTAAYHMIANGTFYQDLGADHFNRRAKPALANRLVAKLQQLGVAIELEDVQAQLGTSTMGSDGAWEGGALGRPHVARALVDCGACDDISDAFRRYLGRGRAAYVEKPLPNLNEVTGLVHGVGGLTFAAHLGDHGTEGQIRVFQDHGLDGIEVRHPSHAPAVEQRLTRIAERLGLAISGGSDWHGESEYGESHAPLGGMQVPDAWLEQLERRLETTGRKRA